MIFILTSSLNLIFTRTIHSYQLNQINVSLNMVQPMKYRIYNLKLVKRTQKKICAVDKSTADKKWILDRTLSETSYDYHWHLRMFAHTIWTIHIVVCDELFIGTCRNVCDCMCVWVWVYARWNESSAAYNEIRERIRMRLNAD